MKKIQIGNIIKTKAGDKCIVVDIHDNEAVVFNLCEMEPQTIKISDIKGKIGDANCTTTIINGKKTVRNKDEEEATEVTENENTENTETESEEIERNPAELLGELVKLFGKAAIEVGNIITELAESDEDDN